MLPPEVIERMKRWKGEREERDSPAARLPLYPPEDMPPDRRIEDEEPTESSRVIVIEP